MSPWSDFRAGFEALLKRLSDVPAYVTQPRDEGVDFTFPADDGQVALNYSIVSEVPVGRDELRTVYDPDQQPPGDTYAGPGAPLGSVIYGANGNREMVIELRCDKYWQSQPAFAVLQAIRDKLWLPSVRRDCAAIGIAVQKSGKIQRYDWSVDGRAVSTYLLEITVNLMSNATDGLTTTIEVVNAETPEISP